MEHELIIYWPDREPTSTTYKTKMAAMERAAQAMNEGAIRTDIRLVSSGI